MGDGQDGHRDALAIVGAIANGDMLGLAAIQRNANLGEATFALAGMLIYQLNKQEIDVAGWVARGQAALRDEAAGQDDPGQTAPVRSPALARPKDPLGHHRPG